MLSTLSFLRLAESLYGSYPLATSTVCRSLLHRVTHGLVSRVWQPDDKIPEILQHILKTPPTDQQINKLAGRLGSEWEHIVLSLGLTQNDLYRCKVSYPFNVQLQIVSAFILWRQRLGKKATVETLCASLRLGEVDFSVIQQIFQ